MTAASRHLTVVRRSDQNSCQALSSPLALDIDWAIGWAARAGDAVAGRAAGRAVGRFAAVGRNVFTAAVGFVATPWMDALRADALIAALLLRKNEICVTSC